MGDLSNPAADVQLTDESTGNKAVITTDGKLKVETSQAAGVAQSVNIEDPNDAYKAKVDATGRLQVSTSTPTPPSTTPVTRTIQVDKSGSQTDEYLIPNGETLTIQTFWAGAEGDGKTSKAELYYDPNGNGSGMTLIMAAYVGNTNSQADINEEFVGNGTRKIRLKVTRLDAGKAEMFARWKGYY